MEWRNEEEKREYMNKQRREKLIFDDHNNYFGHCKHLNHDNFYRNVRAPGDTRPGKTHIMCCDTCKICWCIGHNLFSGWRYEDPEVWDRNYEEIKDFEYIG
jgi:hypothetical protein